MLLPSVRSRPGLDEFSLGLNLFTAEFQLALDEIGLMTRNPERDTERSRVVRARSPSLKSVTHVHLNVGGNVKFGAGDWIPGTGMMREFAWYRGMGLIDFV
jgi:hypothetical protein